MRIREITVLVLAGIVLALLASCGGDDAGGSGASAPEGGSARDGGRTSGLLLSDAADVMGASAEAFQQDVQSVQGELNFTFGSSQLTMSANGDFAFDLPDRGYLTLEFGGAEDSAIDLSALGPFEILLLGDQIYMNTGFTGWVVMSLDDLGVNGDQFQQLLSAHAPFDYTGLIGKLGAQVQYVGEEERDGAPAAHYRMSMDFEDLLDALSETLGSDNPLGGGIGDSLGIAGPVVGDVWIDSETYLPHEMTFGGTFTTGSEEVSIEVGARFFGYNEAVRIPEPPADAKPFSDLMEGGLFPDTGG